MMPETTRRGFMGLMAGLMAAAVVPTAIIEDELQPLVPVRSPLPDVMMGERCILLPLHAESWSLRGTPSGASLQLPKGSSGSARMLTQSVPYQELVVRAMQADGAARHADCARHVRFSSFRVAGGASLFVSEHVPAAFFRPDELPPGFRSHPILRVPNQMALEVEWVDLPGDFVLQVDAICEVLSDRA